MSMEKQDWNIIKTVIDEVLEQPEETQIRYLEDSIVKHPDLKDEILAHYKSIKDSNEFWQNAFEANQQMITNSIDINGFQDVPFVEYKKGSRVGAYVLDDQIGKGGMGIVFKASRADGQFERTVAIKLMALNIQFDEIRIRFLREQQILASLNHVNIGQLFDAGVTAIGNPYLVMEYVEGKEITEYINSSNASLSQILSLFLEICKAVEYAHRNLIVHRDLKPSNILVTGEGQLKVLDFGIAKLIGESMDEVDSVVTRNQQRLYSLSYASPEQIKGEVISTSTDIYTLGLLLFEMLTNERPFALDNLSRSEAERVLVESTPFTIARKKETLSREYDLSAIVSKCLRKEPDSRYRSVSELMDDIINYQESKPVLAHKGSGIYKARKFWNRNRVSVSFSGIFFIAAILFSVFYTVRINKERLIAQQESEKAQLVTDYLINLFEQADPLGTEGRDQTIADFIKKSMDNLSELSDQPELHQEAAFTLGLVTANLGSYDDSNALFRKSLELAISNNEQPVKVAEIQFNLAELGRATGHYREAVTLYQEAKIMLAQSSETIEREALEFEVDKALAVSFAHIGDIDQAEKLMANLMENLQFDSGEIPVSTIEVFSNLADISREKEDYASSIQFELQALSYLEIQESEKKQELMFTTNNLGFAYRRSGEYQVAIDYYKRSLGYGEELYGTDHPIVLTTLNNLAVVYEVIENYAQSLFYRQEILDRTISGYGEGHWRTGSALGSVALTEAHLEKPEAIQRMQQSVRNFEQGLGQTHFWTLRQKLKLAYVQVISEQVTQGNDLIDSTIKELKDTIEKPLAYYDKSGLISTIDTFEKQGFDSEFQKMNEFLNWYFQNIETTEAQ